MATDASKIDPLAAPLPDWLKRDGDKPTHYTADPEKVYPMILRRLGVKDGEVNQYWLEIAYMILKELIARFTMGTASKVRIERKEAWALLKAPPKEGLVLVGAKDDPAIAKMQMELNCHAARKDWKQYRNAFFRNG